MSVTMDSPHNEASTQAERIVCEALLNNHKEYVDKMGPSEYGEFTGPNSEQLRDDYKAGVITHRKDPTK